MQLSVKYNDNIKYNSDAQLTLLNTLPTPVPPTSPLPTPEISLQSKNTSFASTENSFESDNKNFDDAEVRSLIDYINDGQDVDTQLNPSAVPRKHSRRVFFWKLFNGNLAVGNRFVDLNNRVFRISKFCMEDGESRNRTHFGSSENEAGAVLMSEKLKKKVSKRKMSCGRINRVFRNSG